MNPTYELYSALDNAYNHFNKELFNGELPPVLFTNQRQKGIMGYFAPNRWSSSDGKKCHEIAINPLYVGRASIVELLQTLVHEMCHCWQECFGTPSKKYHNKEWANKMLEIGLVPSSTGLPGGAMVGQSMNDYPAPEGKFIKCCETLLTMKNFTWNWVDRLAYVRNEVNVSTNENVLLEALQTLSPEIAQQLTTNISDVFGEDAFAEEDSDADKKVKSKYTCPSCAVNLWGKRGIRIQCLNCETEFEEL